MKYEDYQVSVMPPWLQGDTAKRFLQALGSGKDDYLENIKRATTTNVISGADRLALGLLGAERNIPSLPGDTIDSLRVRVQAAWDTWMLGGTLAGIETAMRGLGFRCVVIELYKSDITKWAEFSLVLQPDRAFLFTDQWGDGIGTWGDGTEWEWTLNSSTVLRILSEINRVKAGHSKLHQITYQLGSTSDVWGDGLGLWGDETEWAGFPPTILYP